MAGGSWHQPVAGCAHSSLDGCMHWGFVPHWAKGQELYGLHAAIGERHHRRLFLHQPLPILYLLGTDVDTRLFPDWKLGRRASYLLGDQVCAVSLHRYLVDADGRHLTALLSPAYWLSVCHA